MVHESLGLSKPIEAYFTADIQHDAEALAQCFTENAVVKDEGKTHFGRVAIRQWKSDASKKFQYTSEPFHCETVAGKTVITSKLTGQLSR